MIGLEDVYKVIIAMAPLYFALMLGYGSVKWWKMFTREQCDAINQLVAYFTFPLFTFEFTAHSDPFKMNYRFIAADALSKVVIVIVLAIWAKCSSKGSYCWTITSFSLTTLTSSLVIGVPLAEAMYGKEGVDIVVQGSVIQAIVWLTILLLVLEIRRAQNDLYSEGAVAVGVADAEQSQNDLEENTGLPPASAKPSVWSLVRAVWRKLVINPNPYACIIGITWACLSDRWHFEMPTIVEGSIQIMSKAGTGTAMFSMGLFMAQQEKVIACGASLTVVAIVLKFIAGPAAMAICSIAIGLHGDILRVAIIQAALPQSITSFIFAKEYGLHADVLSTSVIFGMLVSLPVLVAYYAILEFIH